MSVETDTKNTVTVNPVVVVKDVTIELDPPSYVGRYCRTQSERAEEYESWAKELQDFIRDHRSQYAVHLTVKRVKETVCSSCGYPWEVCEEDGKKYCAWCGREVTK